MMFRPKEPPLPPVAWTGVKLVILPGRGGTSND